ncbi:hypothetical protein BpHYR1_017671 [Brachionus plicatilis]|uniref:Uncharacterized protein n=1 Tax=Brachionus plicatilis TaxID=10195 RepID=A0A3M7SQT5_BRAPC|nr:hypothetical protein BpHYR1_017671 [Brachionus plicatilis]
MNFLSYYSPKVIINLQLLKKEFQINLNIKDCLRIKNWNLNLMMFIGKDLSREKSDLYKSHEKKSQKVIKN